MKNACRCLNRRIVIEREVTPRAEDAEGGYAVAWETFVSSWAAFESPSGRESLFAGQLQASVTHTIYMPYRSGITAAMRVNYGGSLMNIRAVIDEGERHQELKLLVEQGVQT